MDNDLELDADFPLDMVTIMQEGAIRKACRMVIGRTIRGRPMIKVLNNYLKLHPPTSFVSTIYLRTISLKLYSSMKEEPK